MDNVIGYCYLLNSSLASSFKEEMDEEDFKEYMLDFQKENEYER